MGIAQTLDEFVNNPNMGENRKDELNTQLSKLTADRDVLRWKALQPNSPTIENYETHSKEHKQEKYVTDEKNFALDDIVNGHGNGSLVEGTDEWYAAHKKVSDLDNQLRALNMGKMGQLDGERAVTAEEQAAAEKEEDRLQEDIAYNETLTAKLPADESLTQTERREIDEQITADIAYNDAMQASPYDTQLDAEKQAEKDAAITQLDTQMAEEIAIASDLRTDAYNRGYGYFDLEYKDKNRQAFEGQIRFALGIDASGFTDDELREAFAKSTWVLDDAYDISIDEFVEDITAKYDGMKEEALGKIDDKYITLSTIGEMEENPEVTLVDWTNSLSIDMRFQGYLEEKEELAEIIEKKEEKRKSSEGSEKTKLTNELTALYNRSDYLDTLFIDKEQAMNGNIEDLNLSQLTLRAESDFTNMLKSFEHEVIEDSLGWFDQALEKWTEGDDSDIRNLILDMYDGTKHLEDIENFNDLRNEYVKYAWEVGQYDDILTDRAQHYILEDIGPYFLEKANYKENDNGYTLEIPPNFIDYAIAYSEGKEQGKKDLGDAIGVGGIAAGFVVGIASGGPIGALIGLGIAILAFSGGKVVGNIEDIWDDAINALKPHVGTGNTIILDVNEKDDDVTPIVKEK